MKLFLTKGMFGEFIEQIGSETNNVKTVLENMFAWKNNLDNQVKYKIEKYDRFIFNNENNTIAVDFGDYSTFMLVENVSEKQKWQFIGN